VLPAHIRENLVRVAYIAVGLPQEMQRLNRRLHNNTPWERQKAGTFLSTRRGTTD